MADYDPSGLYYRGSRYLTGRVFDPSNPQYSSNVWSDTPWFSDNIIADRSNLARGYHRGLMRGIQKLGIGGVGGALVSALSYATSLTRPYLSPQTSKHYQLFPRERSKLYPNAPLPPSGHIKLPDDPPELKRQDAFAELPPLKSSHHDGCDEDLLSDNHYLSRTPNERYVRLSTVYDSGLPIATATKFTANIFCPNLLYRTFDNLPGASHPLWAQDAEFWNLFYRDHHVFGFQISITIFPYSDISSFETYVAYLDKGYGELVIPFANLADLQDWQSQSIAKHYTWGKVSLGFGSTLEYDTLNFPYIDCCRDFGSSIANDNRIDERNDGTYTVPTDPKFYIMHTGFAQTHVGGSVVPYPRIQVRLIQDVKFYNPVSNIHA